MLLSALGSHQILRSEGKVRITWLAKNACQKYLKAPIELNMGIQQHKQLKGIEAQIKFITCRQHV